MLKIIIPIWRDGLEITTLDLQNSISCHKKTLKLLFQQGCGIWGPKSTWVALEKGKAGGASPGHSNAWDEGLHIQKFFPWDFPTIIQHTHGKTNPLLAWISIQGMIFVTKNIGNRTWWHLSFCCLLIFPSHMEKTWIQPSLQGWEQAGWEGGHPTYPRLVSVAC